MIHYYYKHDLKNKYEKSKTSNNVLESNNLKVSILVVSILVILTLGVSILTLFKVKPNNSKKFDQF